MTQTLPTPGESPVVTPELARAAPSRLRAEGLTLRYERHEVATGLDFAVPAGEFTAIVGPNGCGKSTLLRALSRTLTPAAGRVLLDGVPLQRLRSKQIARSLALLPQDPIAPDTILVRDLVGRGRHPYHSALRQWLPGDSAIVDRVLAETGVTALAERRVAELSGGQRQRVWLAMVLAQETEIVLLDEPTSFLDIAHQVELLHLCQDLRDAGRTVVAVLHDLNQAARYASRLAVLHGGRIVAEGAPSEVLTEGLVREVFGLDAVIGRDPESGTPTVVPRARQPLSPAGERRGRPGPV
ncbi:ABC transporter ATP-binding protein [Leucobacter sp. M11]|uniref:ABC transporter ATP-binding protein n=1 Tax=Leucobacter sp. M11 TaxID=2993565 RepID=UPI002D7F7264|nr:ABC transporter ATP-binding protein [Leucobacter sp. M11]MEB4614980.1 ABC transporter ATP-binding protein [Leucobacter sp. M11]